MSRQDYWFRHQPMKKRHLDLQAASHAEISRLAFMSWEKDGCPLGHDVDYWLEAESQMKATWHLLEREYGRKRGTSGRPAKSGVVVVVKKNNRQETAR